MGGSDRRVMNGLLCGRVNCQLKIYEAALNEEGYQRRVENGEFGGRFLSEVNLDKEG